MTTTSYWSGSTLVIDWELVDPAGDPVADATVTGEITQPDETTGIMSVTHDAEDQVYRATFVVTQPGTHAWRLEATGTVTGAVEGSIVVQRSLLGLPPVTLDPSTAIGRVRLLATDLDEVSPLLSDTQVQALLNLEHGRIRRAAAQALDTIASSEVLISKKIKTLDLSTDGPAVAKELRERAGSLRQQDDDIDDEGPWGIEIVNYDPWAAYRRTGI